MDNQLNALTALRHGTHDLHEALESKAVFSRLMHQGVGMNDYVQALESLRHAYTVSEPNLMQGLKMHTPTYHYHSRLPLLQRDLTSLRGTAPPFLAPTESDECTSVAETLGVLYVIEGSTLGGQVLMRHLQDQLGDSFSNAMSFYSLDGKLDIRVWGAAKKLINSNLLTQCLLDEAIEAARRTFTSFLNYS